MKLSPQLRKAKPGRIGLTIAIGIVLLASLLADLTPRFHLADSQMYLMTRFGGFTPLDRSWDYGLAISWLLRVTKNLVSVPLTQILLSWVAFALFAIAVARSTVSRFSVMAMIVAAGCLEPLGYYWSRSYMSDSPAQSALVLLCAVLLSPFGKWLRFLLILVTAFVLISLRAVYFSAVVAGLCVAVAWQLWNVRRSESKNRFVAAANDPVARSWAAAAVAVLVANLAYAGVNTHMTDGRILSTNITDMAFLAGALSPLMADELDRTPLTAKERAQLVPLTYNNRVSNTFGRNGLVPSIRRHYASVEGARPVMKRLVINSIRDRPFAFAELILQQWADYLNPQLVFQRQRAGVLSGAVPQFPNDPRVVLPDDVIRNLKEWNVLPTPTSDIPSRPSTALSYLEMVGGWWSLVLSYYATCSLLIVLAIPAKDRTPFLVFANSFAFLYMATIAVAANQMVTRYLLPLDVPLIYTAIAAMAARRSP